MADIRFNKVQKLYPNGHHAVSDLNLHVQDGEFLVLVGPSGCGKSTVLRMIAGLEDISEGELLIGGRIVNDLEPKERDISMVFQSYALYPHRTVFENIAFPLELAKVAKTELEERVLDVANILELTGQLDKKPGQLSGGQRQRVAMGRAIVRKPSVYLLDEPLSNLDAQLRDQTRSEMVDLQARLGVTTVYVTHDQVEALTMGHRVAVLKDGVLQQVAPPRELYSSPANMFVAGFIGTPAMNFLPARVEGGMITLAGIPVPVDERLTLPEGDLVVGARPEQLMLADAGISGEVIGIEDLGVESIIRIRADLQGLHKPLVLRTEGQTDLTRSDLVIIGFKSTVHLFGTNGDRIGGSA